MRILGDITVPANNGKLRKREPSWRKMQSALESEHDENAFNAPAFISKHKNAPHFMSPTMASNSGAASPPGKAATRTSTPTSLASSTTKSRSWVASAVKRVAMRRSGNATTPAKEETTLPTANNFARSDKVYRRINPPFELSILTPRQISAPLTSQPQKTPSPLITRKPVLTDKPLPSPPIAHVTTVSPSKQSRSLMDASEKPLRRSPPGKPHQEEDWPVLIPEKSTTPETLQKMARPEGPYPSVRAMRIAHRERLSARADAESKFSSIQRKAVTNDSPSPSSQSIDRKAVHESGMHNLQGVSRDKTTAATDSLPRYVREVHSEQDLRTSAFKEHIPRAETPSPHTAVQKSVDRMQDLSYSRPTKLSSLRARTPTGRPSTEVAPSNNKVLDSKDSSTPNGNSATTAIRVTGSKGKSMVASRLPLAEHRTNVTKSSSRINGDRAPSKPTIRTRHPEIFTRSNSSSPVPFLYSQPPNKPLPPVPTFSGPRQAGLGADENVPKASSPGLHKSSIPVLRRHGTGSARGLGSEPETLAKRLQKGNEGQQNQETSLRVLENAVTAVSMAAVAQLKEVEAVDTYSPPNSSGNICNTIGSQATQLQDQITCGKETTVKSKHGTRIKRLSRLSPDHGPVLKISPSADMIIMGKESGQEENVAAHSKKTKDLHRTVVTKELRKASFGSVPRPTTIKQTPRARPSSAAGDLQLASRHIASDSKARERKAMSVGATHPSQTLGSLQKLTSRPSLKASTSKHAVPAVDDPFSNPKSQLETVAEPNPKGPQCEVATEPVDTPAQLYGANGSIDTKSEPADGVGSEDIQIYIEGGASSNDTETGSVHEGKMDDHVDVNNGVASYEASGDVTGISPKSDHQGSRRSSDEVPDMPFLPPVTIQGQPPRTQNDSNAEQVMQGGVPVSRTLYQTPSSPIDMAKGKDGPREHVVTIQQMITPPRQSSSITGTCLRRPSNLDLHDFPPRSSSRAYVHDFTTERYKTSPTSTKNVDPRLSKDFQPIQEKLGSSKGVPSIRYDPGASRSRRTSITRESNKTQASISKGMLSNFRGLFHKRSSDASDQPSARSTKCGKRAAVTAAGRPYPPISEIHPIHRPLRHRKTGSTTRSPTPEALWGPSSRADTLVSHSSKPSDTSITNSLTVELINSAKKASPGPRQDRLWELSSIMVQAVTNARDAEKAKEEAKQAMEEAKQAARKAEMCCILTHKRAADLARFVQEHRDVLE